MADASSCSPASGNCATSNATTLTLSCWRSRPAPPRLPEFQSDAIASSRLVLGERLWPRPHRSGLHDAKQPERLIALREVDDGRAAVGIEVEDQLHGPRDGDGNRQLISKLRADISDNVKFSVRAVGSPDHTRDELRERVVMVAFVHRKTDESCPG